jgi:hypothetical protein
MSLQFCIAILLIVMGFTTYFLVPLAFITGNFAMFLSILSSILLGMLLGLTLISQSLQVEKPFRSTQRLFAFVVSNPLVHTHARTHSRTHSRTHTHFHFHMLFHTDESWDTVKERQIDR